MTQSLGSTKERIAQAFYVVGGLISVVLLVFCIVALMIIIDTLALKNPNSWQLREARAAREAAMMTLGFACFAYGAGWGLRWIISGTSTSVICYFRDPMRIVKNLFAITSFAVLVLFSIVMPYLGFTRISGPPSTLFFEGLGHSLAVLILSCVGLLYKTDRDERFVLAAVVFSLALIIAFIVY